MDFQFLALKKKAAEQRMEARQPNNARPTTREIPAITMSMHHCRVNPIIFITQKIKVGLKRDNYARMTLKES